MIEQRLRVRELAEKLAREELVGLGAVFSAGYRSRDHFLFRLLSELQALGLQSVWNRRPPAEWVLDSSPKFLRYGDVLSLSNGLVAICESTTSRVERFREMDFGWLVNTGGPMELLSIHYLFLDRVTPCLSRLDSPCFVLEGL